MRRLTAAAVAIWVLTGAALADETPDPAAQRAAAEDSMLGLLTMKAGAEASEADHGFTRALQALQQNLMKTEMSGDAGGDFVRMMLLHEQSAIDIIDVLLAEHDLPPELRKMAEDMRRQRARDIRDLQDWLDRHHG